MSAETTAGWYCSYFKCSADVRCLAEAVLPFNAWMYGAVLARRSLDGAVLSAEEMRDCDDIVSRLLHVMDAALSDATSTQDPDLWSMGCLTVLFLC
jgi:hypothetical protein